MESNFEFLNSRFPVSVNFSETETRLLIDEQLRKVGWEADTENLRYSNGTHRGAYPEPD